MKKPRGPGKPIQKGQVLNPTGKGGHHPEKTKIRKLTQEQVAEMMSLIVKQDMTTIERIAADSTRFSAHQVWIANIVKRGVETGSIGNLDFLYDRTIGPVEKNVKLDVTNSLSNASDEAILKELEEIKNTIKK